MGLMGVMGHETYRSHFPLGPLSPIASAFHFPSLSPRSFFSRQTIALGIIFPLDVDPTGKPLDAKGLLAMNQTPAAILVLAAAALSYAANAASMSSNNQSSVLLTICAVAVGAWGAISLAVASMREREALIDGHARLDLLDRVMVREPLRALKEVARPVAASIDSRRPLEISADIQARLNAIARAEGRDRSEVLEETLRLHLPKLDHSSRVA